MIDFEIKENQERVAIVVVGYNRIKSITRLLHSLLKGDYSQFDSVPLVISIDASGDEELYKYVEDFEWPFGEKYVRIQKKRLGLKNHILSCGDLTEFFKAIILLEDDIYVTPNFYNYTCQVIDYYDSEPKVASISLYNEEMNGFCWLPFPLLHKDSDVYAVQAVFSWGECWTKRMWKGFRDWNEKTQIDWDKVDMPPQIKTWEKAWSKFYHAYMVINDLYSICPYVSLTTNFSDAGEHGGTNNTIVQTNIQYGYKEYALRPFSGLVKYDSFNNNTAVSDHLNIPVSDICIDFYGVRENTYGKRYWLTIRRLPYKIEKQFGLFLRPQEINVLYDVPGDDIYLYDTSVKATKPKKKNHGNVLLYHLHGFNYKYLPVACWVQMKVLVKKAWNKYVIK